MGKIFGDAKPSLEELAHHGVKGMQWGVRKTRSTSAEIHTARARQTSRHETLRRLTKTAQTAKSPSVRAAAAKQQQKVTKDILTNEDRVVAARMTTGEKAAHLILLGPVSMVTLTAAGDRARRTERMTDAARKQT